MLILERPEVSGDTARLLTDVLFSVGISKGDVSITSTVRCDTPLDPKTRSSRKPTGEETLLCRQYLVRELRSRTPRVVVPMGNEAIISTLGKSGVRDMRGTVYNRATDNGVFPDESLAACMPHLFFVPTFGLTSALPDAGNSRWIAHDILKAQRLALYGLQRTPVNYGVLGTVAEVQRVLAKLYASTTDFVAFDVETTSLDFMDGDILCISFSNRCNTGYVIPIYGFEMREIWTAQDKVTVLQLIRQFLESDVPKGAQNGVFDVNYIRKAWGADVNNWSIDTMLLHHLVDESAPHKLNHIAGVYTDIGPYWETLTAAKPKKGNYSDIPEDVLWKYAAADADVCYRAGQILIAKAWEEGTMGVHDEIVLPMAKVMAEAEYHGIRVNVDEIDRQHAVMTERKEGLEQRVYEHAGEEFNIGSPLQLGYILFDKLKLPKGRVTETGKYATDEKEFDRLRGLHPVVGLVEEIRGIIHDQGNYLRGKDGVTGIMKFVYPDGRVHPRWRLTSAVTGRLSCSDPAIQNIKKVDEDEEDDDQIVFRKLFCATEDWYWISADYSQAELRVVAYVSGDEHMMHVLLTRDIHREVAADMFKIAPELVTGDQRRAAKCVNFGIIYGMEAVSLARDLGCSKVQAQAYLDAFFSMFPKVKEYQDRITALVNMQEYVVNPFMRRERFPGLSYIRDAQARGKFSSDLLFKMMLVEGGIHRKAINFGVQGTANEVMCKATIRIHAELARRSARSRLLISHHDAWNGEAPEDELQDSLFLVKSELERPIPELGGLVLPVDFEVGRYWGDKSVKVKGF